MLTLDQLQEMKDAVSKVKDDLYSKGIIDIVLRDEFYPEGNMSIRMAYQHACALSEELRLLWAITKGFDE